MTRDAAGNRLNNAPEWSGSGSAVYEFATGRAGTASVRGDVSRQSRVFFTPFNDAHRNAEARMRSCICGRASSRVTADGRLPSYARNVANTEYLTGTANVPLPAFTGRPGEPRQWGTQFTLRP